MVSIYVPWICLGILLVPLVAVLEQFELLSLSLVSTWQVDYEHAVCGRLAALQRNLAAARQMVEGLSDNPSLSESLQRLEEQTWQTWQAAYQDELVNPCRTEGATAFQLYWQENPDLPANYPNWWVHWSSPAGEGPEL